MNWEAIGAVGEVVGALAVVLTLAYLAVQIRQNTNLSKADALQRSTDQYTKLLLDIGSNPELRATWVRISNGGRLNELDSEGQFLVEVVLRALFNTASKDFAQTELGIATTEYWYQVRDYLQIHMLPSPLVNDWWQSSVIPANSYEKEFRNWVSNELKEIHDESQSIKA